MPIRVQSFYNIRENPVRVWFYGESIMNLVKHKVSDHDITKAPLYDKVFLHTRGSF